MGVKHFSFRIFSLRYPPPRCVFVCVCLVQLMHQCSWPIYEAKEDIKKQVQGLLAREQALAVFLANSLIRRFVRQLKTGLMLIVCALKRDCSAAQRRWRHGLPRPSWPDAHSRWAEGTCGCSTGSMGVPGERDTETLSDKRSD